LTILAGAACVSVEIGSSGAWRWIVVAAGVALMLGGGYWLVGNEPRLTVSKDGLEWGYVWSRRSVHWTEVAFMRELHWTRGVRLLALNCGGSRQGARINALLFNADFAINVSALERSPADVLALVEAFSGRRIQRVG
jgi:hypothetical protein